jgi:hypothetical protein
MARATWADLHATRAARHWLSGPDPKSLPSTGQTAARLCGIQAQVASTATICMGARHRRAPAKAVLAAVNDGSAVRMWAMRDTLHLIAAEETHWYAAAIADSVAARETRLWPKNGVPADAEERLNAALFEALRDGALSRAALAERVGEACGPEYRRLLEHPWGIALKPAVARGLVEMRGAGANVTFQLPARALIGHERSEAQQWLASCFLDANVIATPASFATWSGLSRREARAALDATASDVLDLDGVTYAMRGPLRRAGESSDVRLVPAFDPYTLAVPDKAAWCRTADSALIWRRGGWISAVVLRCGMPVGVWSVTTKRTVAVTPFTGLSTADKAAVAAESRRVDELYAMMSASGAASAMRSNP